MIRKLKNKRLWRLYSKTSHRNLGTFSTKRKAMDREKQIQYFKKSKK
jgi:hypothetical protein